MKLDDLLHKAVPALMQNLHQLEDHKIRLLWLLLESDTSIDSQKMSVKVLNSPSGSTRASSSLAKVTTL